MRKKNAVVLCSSFSSIENYVGKMNSNTDISSNGFFIVQSSQQSAKKK